jgi:hypothetical protein
MQLREACIILPLTDNEGVSLDSVHTEVQEAFAYHWDGWTSQPITGGWRDLSGQVRTEHSVLYTVAMQQDDHGINRLLLHSLADYILEAARQQSVYVRHTDGTVEFASHADSMRSLESIREANRRRMQEVSEHIVSANVAGTAPIRVIPGITSNEAVALLQNDDVIILHHSQVEEFITEIREIVRAQSQEHDEARA